MKRLSRVVDEAVRHKRLWLERVRAGLVAFLGFLDDEPAWGRLLLDAPVEDATSGCVREQRVMGVLSGLLGEGAARVDGGAREVDDSAREINAGPPQVHAGALRIDNGGTSATGGLAREPAADPTLTAELVIGGVVSTVRARMARGCAGTVRGEWGAFIEMAPSLMAFIVAPYLGQAAAQAELEGKASAASDLVSESGLARARALSRAGELPIRATHRTTLVLRAIARAPYSNNREVAQAAGLSDEGQTSKLLARLERRGVIENVGAGPARGEPNAWLLTPSGQRAIELLAASPAANARVSGTGAMGAA